MPEILLTIVVLFGQLGACLSVFNRKLINMKKGAFRTVATALAAILLIGIPLEGLAHLHHRGILSELAHFRGPQLAVIALVAYLAIVVVAYARFLWLSLITLPYRKRPSVVVREKRSLCLYRPDEDQRMTPTCRWWTANPLARWNCRFDLEVNEFTVAPLDLPPALDGFRIVHLSDIHAMRTRPEGWYDLVADIVERLEPDLIAITGDFLVTRDDFVRVEHILPRLRAPHGVWAILGNHDFWEAPDRLTELLARHGVGLLGNRQTEIRFNGAAFDLVGLEAPWNRAAVPWDDLLRASSNQTKIVLSHTPDHASRVARTGATLMLAGHTHGGQLRLPGIGSLIVPSRYGKRYDEGWFAVGSLALYVSRGIGAFSPDLRLACRPEITRFVLRANR